ncbi:MAG: OmpA family protein [Gammaproteobacteria bacterium]|nr:OmpA family protein [Gammaproteobacteria bacterium]
MGLMVWALQALPLTFQASVEETEWRLSPSIFECEFVQPIPDYGEAVFYHEAGEDLLFRLKTKKNLMGKGEAALHIEPPVWGPSRFAEDLGLVPVKQASITLQVEPKRANHMMQALMQGMQPTFTRKARYDANEPIRISVSAANFNSFYKDYLGCVAGLLPVNFRQVAKSKVLFKGGGDFLDKESKKKLDLIILYVKADPKVKALYIDGHSDSSGRRYNNRRLSEERALKVTDYMVKKGLDPEMFTTRYHGERYPVATNKTAAGRQQNRRVTIRLEKEDEEMDQDF